MDHKVVKKLLLDNFVLIDRADIKKNPQAQLIDGQWYAPKWRCDTLQFIIDKDTLQFIIDKLEE